MPATVTLISAQQLADANKAHFPNESAEYREARNGLLVEEIELRRYLERVATLRRALPPGGEIPKDFELISESGAIHFSGLFGNKDTLLIYSMSKLFSIQDSTQWNSVEPFRDDVGLASLIVSQHSQNARVVQ